MEIKDVFQTLLHLLSVVTLDISHQKNVEALPYMTVIPKRAGARTAGATRFIKEIQLHNTGKNPDGN